MNKYIPEKGIILLINQYAANKIEDILKLIYSIEHKIYYNAAQMTINELQSMKCSWPLQIHIPCNYIIIYMLTNNYFIILKPSRWRTTSYDIHKIKINRNEKKLYVKILEKSTNVHPGDFMKTYNKLIKSGERTRNQPSMLEALILIKKHHNIKLYNIKLLFKGNILKSIYKPFNILIYGNDYICYFHDIFGEIIKENIIINTEEFCHYYSKLWCVNICYNIQNFKLFNKKIEF
jgi:hypothetical protein